VLERTNGNGNGYHEGAAAQALGRIGFDGERLLSLARKVANEELRRKASTLGNRYEDFVSFLVEVGLRAAIGYDAGRSGNGYSPSSYLWDVMERRTPDFYRRQSEGFGDRRYGNDNRELLGGDAMEDEPDPDVDFGKLVSEHRLIEWQVAARTVDLPIAEWICVTLDRATAAIKRTAQPTRSGS
jgi:hypothetical protein